MKNLFPTRREWWIIFHSRSISKLLNEREKLIRKLVETCNEYTLRLANKGPGLTDIMNLREEERTRGAVLGHRAAMRKQMDTRTDHESPPVPNED